MDALASAGRRVANAHRESVPYTILSRLATHSGAIVLSGIPRVIARDNRSFTEEGEWLRSRGVSIDVVRGRARAALMKEFVQTHPEPGNEDVGE